jgi:hypothetical protein
VLVVPACTSHIAPLSTPQAMAHGSGWGCCCGPMDVVASLSFHPRSTPRAVACEAGGRWCVVCFHAVSCRSLLSPSPRPAVPPKHPASSGSQQWWVVWLVVLASPSPRCPHHHHCHSTRNPPHEQLLMRLGAGGVSFVAVCGGRQR